MALAQIYLIFRNAENFKKYFSQRMFFLCVGVMKMKNLLIFEMESLNLIIYLGRHVLKLPLYFVSASMLFFCVASFSTPSAFLVAPSYTTSPVLKKTLSFDNTLSFARCVLRLCFDVVFLCCIVSYALRIPRCSVLHHVACLGKDALI